MFLTWCRISIAVHGLWCILTLVSLSVLKIFPAVKIEVQYTILHIYTYMQTSPHIHTHTHTTTTGSACAHEHKVLKKFGIHLSGSKHVIFFYRLDQLANTNHMAGDLIPFQKDVSVHSVFPSSVTGAYWWSDLGLVLHIIVHPFYEYTEQVLFLDCCTWTETVGYYPYSKNNYNKKTSHNPSNFKLDELLDLWRTQTHICLVQTIRKLSVVYTLNCHGLWLYW